MSEPKVLIVPASYFSGRRAIGGGERYAHRYAQQLARHVPTTLALLGEEDSETADGDLIVRTFRARTLDPGAWLPLGRDALRTIGLFDVVHVMVFPTPLTDQLVFNARLRGQTVVLTDVGGGIPCLSTYLSQLYPSLSVSRLASGFAFLSRQSAAQFGQWANPRILLYGGAGLEGAAPAPDAQAEPYALFVGRLLPHKGILELIEAMPHEYLLHIVGSTYDAEYRKRIDSAAAAKRVVVFEGLDDEGLRSQYSGARLVLQPSVPVNPGARDTSELLGLVALEGMAYGKPVIVTDAGSLPELVEDGKSGFVVPAGDRNALGDRIHRLMSDMALAEEMGQRAARRVAEHFNWDTVVRNGLDFYKKLMAPND